jgi:uncharacterized protein (DUF4415 family)
MREERIVRRTLGDTHADRTDWERVKAMTEEEIDEAARSDPDAQPTDEAFWEDAVLVMPAPKGAVCLRIDREVLDWFRSQGKGYQTRINEVLRAYMEAQMRKRK